MKQEEIIYIQIREGSNREFEMYAQLNTHEFGIQKNVIVLTIEELREVFKDGYNDGKLYQQSADDAFKSWMEYKGINI